MPRAIDSRVLRARAAPSKGTTVSRLYGSWCFSALLLVSTYVLFEDAGEAGRCTRPNFVSRNIMEKSPKQEKVGADGAPNLRQIQVLPL